nr:PREDICTED: facilitated trehalose transporter Tret1-like isoform X2 [Linepithema humile]
MQSNNTEYSIHLTSDEASWVAALFMIGGIPGSIVCAFIVNVIGRKNTMLFTAVPSIISWLMIVFATSTWELYISRFISGLAMGISATATPMYLGEISPANIRGNLASMLTAASKLGTLIEYVIGPFLSVKNLALVSLAGPCLFVVTFIWLPESPYYLMRCDAKQKAIDSLIQLRGKGDVHKEADSIERIVKIDLANETGFQELLFVSGNRRALIILLCLGTLQQMSGSQAILQYAQLIFDQANINLEGKYLTMILGIVQVIFTIVCMMITDGIGRKPLLIISAFGSACSTAIVALYFNLQYCGMDISKIAWLPVIGVFTYIVMYSLGLGPLLLTMSSELFATNVKALGSTITVIVLNASAFTVVKSYLLIAGTAGVHVPFWIFFTCSFIIVLLTFFYIPETKGKTLEQIVEKLHKLPKK